VNALIEEESHRFRTATISPDVFDRSVRLALAMEQAARENRIDALATFEQAWLADPRVGIIANYGASRLCSLGIPSVPEGDVPTAVSMLLLQELAGQSTMVENYVMDFDRNMMMLFHDGTGNPTLATRPTEVSLKPSIYYQGVNGVGAAFEFVYAPGDVTILSLVPLGNGRWRFIAAEGKSLPMELRPLCAPLMTFSHSSGSLEQYCNDWCSAGAPHHMALAYGRLTSKVKQVAELLDVEFVMV